MKKIILFLVLANITIGLFAQTDFFYQPNGEKELFKIRKDKILIKAKSEDYSKELLSRDVFISAFRLNRKDIVASIDTAKNTFEDLRKDPNIVDVAYGLEYADSTLYFPTKRIFIKSKEGLKIESVIEKTKLKEIIEKIELIDVANEIYLVNLKINIGEVLGLTRKLYESGLFEFVEPSLLSFVKPSNTYYSSQWGLKNTGQSGGTSGVDINAEAAWAITNGSNSIKVAVIDEGVDLTHPDLQANLLAGYDAVPAAESPGGANGSPYGNNAHGTACAGIIAALNNTIGIRGIASNVKILPVRIGYRVDGSNLLTTETLWIVNGINHTRLNADVLSNSWKQSASSATITNAINNATTQGRSGKGCIVVFSAGNDGSSSTVNYPANLSSSNSAVIAVGAIDKKGERSSFSNYGTALNVVAPGEGIYVTDIQGTAGYNTNSGTAGNYYENFNGTSAACPFVAGVAALILSAKPSLTGAEVRYLIEQTARKLSDHYVYINNNSYPNGTWNANTGYGLVNAGNAVASAIYPISGASTINGLNNTATYTIQNLPSGATVTWTWSSNLSASGGSTGSSKTFTATAICPVAAWVKATVTIGSFAYNLPQKDITISHSISGTYTQAGSTKALNSINYCSYTGGTITINLQNISGASYSWTGAIIGTGSTKSYTPSSPSGFSTTVTRTISGCQQSAGFSFDVTYDPGGCVAPYNPDNGTIVISFDDRDIISKPTLSLQSTESKTVESVKTKAAYQARLIDISGIVLKETQSPGEPVSWNIAALPAGVYVVQIVNLTTGETKTEKILKP
ncbi:MAG: S8 family serine peptidase [Prevotellaceae bacterium]|jgi:subtilisin family serine protease|nr:S8 family serine peptidase [Prevotellaceae bacterium]